MLRDVRIERNETAMIARDLMEIDLLISDESSMNMFPGSLKDDLYHTIETIKRKDVRDRCRIP